MRDPWTSLGLVAEQTEQVIDEELARLAVQLGDRVRRLGSDPLDGERVDQIRAMVGEELDRVYGSRRNQVSVLQRTIEQQARRAEQAAVDPVVRRIDRVLDRAPELRERLGLPHATE